MADSYNELFGLGTHSADSALMGQWLLQDDGTSTTLVDEQGSRNLTITSWDSTSGRTTTGPNSGYLSSAINFFGWGSQQAQYGGGSSARWSHDDFTYLIWAKCDDATNLRTLMSTGGAEYYQYRDLTAERGRYRVQSRDAVSGGYASVTTTHGSDSSDWHHYSMRDNQSSRYGSYDLTNSSTDSTSQSCEDDNRISVGGRWRGGTSDNYFNGKLAGAALFSRILTDDEVAEHKNGPEPLNTVAPSVSGDTEIGSTLSCDGGSWNSQSNGTVTIAYQWLQDGSEISGETSSTYTTTSDDASTDISCRCTASNDGGYDSDQITTSNSLTIDEDEGYSSTEGSVAATLQGVASSSAAAVVVAGSTATTLDGVTTASAAAAVAVAGSVATTLDGVVGTGTIDLSVQGTSLGTLNGVTLQAQVSLVIAGLVNQTLQGTTVSSSIQDEQTTQLLFDNSLFDNSLFERTL